jgi:superfamily II RNA helicase
MATEVNEGHPLMMTELYLSGVLKGNPHAIAALAAFMTERSVHDDELESVHDELQPIIDTLLTIKKDMVDENPDNWRLSTQYVNIAYDWITGKTAADICDSYGIFEGNLTRLIMKLYNLQEELNTLATLTNDVATLDALRSLNLVQGIAVPDSLYLKI